MPPRKKAAGMAPRAALQPKETNAGLKRPFDDDAHDSAPKAKRASTRSATMISSARGEEKSKRSVKAKSTLKKISAEEKNGQKAVLVLAEVSQNDQNDCASAEAEASPKATDIQDIQQPITQKAHPKAMETDAMITETSHPMRRKSRAEEMVEIIHTMKKQHALRGGASISANQASKRVQFATPPATKALAAVAGAKAPNVARAHEPGAPQELPEAMTYYERLVLAHEKRLNEREERAQKMRAIGEAIKDANASNAEKLELSQCYLRVLTLFNDIGLTPMPTPPGSQGGEKAKPARAVIEQRPDWAFDVVGTWTIDATNIARDVRRGMARKYPDGLPPFTLEVQYTNNPRHTKIGRQLWGMFRWGEYVGCIRMCPGHKYQSTHERFEIRRKLEKGIWPGTAPRGTPVWNFRYRVMDGEGAILHNFIGATDDYETQLQFEGGSDGKMKLRGRIVWGGMKARKFSGVKTTDSLQNNNDKGPETWWKTLKSIHSGSKHEFVKHCKGRLDESSEDESEADEIVEARNIKEKQEEQLAEAKQREKEARPWPTPMSGKWAITLVNPRAADDGTPWSMNIIETRLGEGRRYWAEFKFGLDWSGIILLCPKSRFDGTEEDEDIPIDRYEAASILGAGETPGPPPHAIHNWFIKWRGDLDTRKYGPNTPTSDETLAEMSFERDDDGRLTLSGVLVKGWDYGSVMFFKGVRIGDCDPSSATSINPQALWAEKAWKAPMGQGDKAKASGARSRPVAGSSKENAQRHPVQGQHSSSGASIGGKDMAVLATGKVAPKSRTASGLQSGHSVIEQQPDWAFDVVGTWKIDSTQLTRDLTPFKVRPEDIKPFTLHIRYDNNRSKRKIGRQLWATFEWGDWRGCMRMCPGHPYRTSHLQFYEDCVLDRGVWPGPAPRGTPVWNFRWKGEIVGERPYILEGCDEYETQLQFSQDADGTLRIAGKMVVENYKSRKFVGVKVDDVESSPQITEMTVLDRWEELRPAWGEEDREEICRGCKGRMDDSDESGSDREREDIEVSRERYRIEQAEKDEAEAKLKEEDRQPWPTKMTGHWEITARQKHGIDPEEPSAPRWIQIFETEDERGRRYWAKFQLGRFWKGVLLFCPPSALEPREENSITIKKFEAGSFLKEGVVAGPEPDGICNWLVKQRGELLKRSYFGNREMVPEKGHKDDFTSNILIKCGPDGKLILQGTLLEGCMYAPFKGIRTGDVESSVAGDPCLDTLWAENACREPRPPRQWDWKSPMEQKLRIESPPHWAWDVVGKWTIDITVPLSNALKLDDETPSTLTMFLANTKKPVGTGRQLWATINFGSKIQGVMRFCPRSAKSKPIDSLEAFEKRCKLKKDVWPGDSRTIDPPRCYFQTWSMRWRYTENGNVKKGTDDIDTKLQFFRCQEEGTLTIQGEILVDSQVMEWKATKIENGGRPTGSESAVIQRWNDLRA